eukprot:scaffold92283_cov75-Phaeocystis_antarctica.AAC.11
MGISPPAPRESPPAPAAAPRPRRAPTQIDRYTIACWRRRLSSRTDLSIYLPTSISKSPTSRDASTRLAASADSHCSRRRSSARSWRTVRRLGIGWRTDGEMVSSIERAQWATR